MKQLYRSPAITLGQQISRMKVEFPDFNYSWSSNLTTWKGLLQPSPTSPVYHVKIKYRYNNYYSKAPEVWILSPTILSNAPHRYSDHSLCLYYPKERNWTPYTFISETIIPWTSLWLAFYEIWLETDKWYGPEAKHEKSTPKRKH